VKYCFSSTLLLRTSNFKDFEYFSAAGKVAGWSGWLELYGSTPMREALTPDVWKSAEELFDSLKDDPIRMAYLVKVLI